MSQVRVMGCVCCLLVLAGCQSAIPSHFQCGAPLPGRCQPLHAVNAELDGDGEALPLPPSLSREVTYG